MFTPSENYQGFTNEFGNKVTFDAFSDKVVPGDGKLYIAYVRYFTQTYGAQFIMKKYDMDFYANIT